MAKTIEQLKEEMYAARAADWDADTAAAAYDAYKLWQESLKKETEDV